MTITYVGAGTAATANNASVTPGAVSGVAVGDLVLVLASIRTGTVVVPSGWTEIRAQGGMSVFGRFWQTGDALPLVGFSGGAANADTIARAFAFRGVASDALTASTTAGLTNSSAANIAYPALSVPGDRHAVVIAAWKADDVTALSTPAGYTSIGARTSLLPIDGTFEAGITGWGAPTGGTFVSSSAQAHGGTKSGLLTVTGSPAQAYVRPSSGVAVTPFSTFTLTMWARSATTPSASVSVDWSDSGGSYLSTSAQTLTLVANTWTSFSSTVTAPAGAAFASVGPTLGSSPATGTLLYVDDLNFSRVTDLTTTTTGDDATQAAWYSIQTTDTDLASGSITVTGGAAAVSSAIEIALHPAPTLTITEQDEYPPRVLVSLTGLVVGVDSVRLYRRVGGVETELRGSSALQVTDTSVLLVDAELPFGVPVFYVAYVNGSARYESAAATYTLPGGKVALTDAITGNAVEGVIMAWDEKQYDRNASVFRVGGRNVVVSGDMGQYEADITIYLDADSSNDQMAELLATATENVLQLRQAGGYAGVDSYFVVTSSRQARFSQDGTDPRRTWILHVVEVDGWAFPLEASGYTLQDIADFYGTSGTLANLAADYPTLLAIAQASW